MPNVCRDKIIQKRLYDWDELATEGELKWERREAFLREKDNNVVENLERGKCLLQNWLF